MTKTQTAAQKAGDFDGMLRASSPRYEDFDPRGGFVSQRTLTESEWPEYKSAYERAYRSTLTQYGRAP